MPTPLDIRSYTPDMSGFEVETVFLESGGLKINLRYGKEYLYEDEGLKNTITDLERLLSYFKEMEKKNGD